MANQQHLNLLKYRVHTLICRGSGLPLFFLVSPAKFSAPIKKRFWRGTHAEL